VPNPNYAAASHPSPVAVSSLPAPAPQTTGSIKPTTTQPITGFSGGWSTVGGSAVVVADGENLDAISRRYGVPQAALLRANGFSSASQVHPGVRLIVPVYNADGAKAASAESKAHGAEAESKSAKAEKEAKAKKDKAEREADASEHKRKKDKLAEAKAAKADKAEKSAKPEKPAKAEKPEKTAKAEQPAKPQAEAKAEAKKPTATDKTPTGSLHPEEATSSEPMTSAQADAAGISPEFRWPARGRIIQGFKAGGNDGINIAVPEGTSVKAAESGVVAYAGNELKGYGNLILIRHPNGFVSAYANNSELEVKRGDQVKRGQIIAKSGQSGNVSSPQLHFELRKGSTPVDPTSYLAGL
jgi:murein DD-endopeptidase MepM/ murein hydrolase activator NlpD